MRNLNKPPRYNVASIQAQQTMGGDVMQSDENGLYVEWRDYVWLLTEKQRLDAEVERLTSMANENAHLHKGIYSLSLNVVQLKDEVERLRKAGDAVCESPYALETDPAVIEWRAAKEGKQS